MINANHMNESPPQDTDNEQAPPFPGGPPTKSAVADHPPEHRGEKQTFRRWKTWWVVAIGVGVLAVLAVALTIGVVLRIHKERSLADQTAEDANAAPRVDVVVVHQAESLTQRTLPGNSEAFLEAAIYGRINGYLKTRLVDIGDKVKAGQLLAEISAPDTDAQLAQAKATLKQSKATLESNKASEIYAKAQELRYRTLRTPGAATEQAYENQLMTLRVDTATVHATEAQIQSNEATVQQLSALVSFERLLAPFDGVITLRNVDPGDLITADNPSTERQLFRVAKIDPLRVFVEVPQVYSTSIKPGQDAILFRREDPERLFKGKVARTTSALNSQTRTLRTEVDVPNPRGELLPGMFLEVKFLMSRESIPVIVPSDAVIVRTSAPKIAVLDDKQTVHYHEVQLGRDFGATVEVSTGLKEGETVIIHPGDDLAEGTKVQPIARDKNRKGSAEGATQAPAQSGSLPEGSGTNGTQASGENSSNANQGPASPPPEGAPEKQTSDTH
jgi:RND family efflux transporter MFP subunit